MWSRISKNNEVLNQSEYNNNKYIDLLNQNVQIYDTLKGFVKVKYLIRNIQKEWCNVVFEGGRRITVTQDHPFETQNGVVLAKDLTDKDEILVNYNAHRIDNENNDKDYYNTNKKCNDKCCFKKIFEENQENIQQIPNEIFSCSNDKKYHFLADMINVMGYVKYNHQNNSLVIQFKTNNKEFALQQMLLIQMLNMSTKIYDNNIGDNNLNNIEYIVEFSPTETLFNYAIFSDMEIDSKDFSKEEDCLTLYTTIDRIVFFNKEQYSYDVTTESEHFEVSGIYSHNCRAFLSPYYEKGGINPIDETDFPVFVGRYNLGAVSLNLPMIFMKAKTEKRDFYNVLDHYLEMIRGIHKKTKEYFGEFKASCNPVAFCYGGLYKGFLKPEEKLKKIMGAETYSFGVTALNELQQLYNQKSIKEDGDFVYEVLEYINKKKDVFIKEDNMLYAIYSTPMFSGRVCSNVYLKIA